MARWREEGHGGGEVGEKEKPLRIWAVFGLFLPTFCAHFVRDLSDP